MVRRNGRRIAGPGRSIFRNLARSARHPKWKGCGFLRTSAELANMPGHPAITIGAAHKKKFEAWLRETFAAAGIAEASKLSRQILLLLDGSFAVVLLHRDAQLHGNCRRGRTLVDRDGAAGPCQAGLATGALKSAAYRSPRRGRASPRPRGSPASEQSAHYPANQPTWTAAAAVVSSAATTGWTVAIGFVAVHDTGVRHRDGLGE